MDKQTILEYGVKLIIIFMILPIHEYAHAWAAHKMGDDTAYYKGRLTLNPLSHIDPLGALLLFFTGFGWAKPVPVNPLRFKKQRKGMAITAAAGPLSNLIVAFIAMIIYRFIISSDFYFNSLLSSHTKDTNWFFILYMIEIFILINIGLALFNLIPVPPLDGSKILQYFTTYKFDAMISKYRTYIYIGLIVLMYTGILRVPLMFLREKVYNVMIYLTNWIPVLMR